MGFTSLRAVMSRFPLPECYPALVGVMVGAADDASTSIVPAAVRVDFPDMIFTL